MSELIEIDYNGNNNINTYMLAELPLTTSIVSFQNLYPHFLEEINKPMSYREIYLVIIIFLMILLMVKNTQRMLNEAFRLGWEVGKLRGSMKELVNKLSIIVGDYKLLKMKVTKLELENKTLANIIDESIQDDVENDPDYTPSESGDSDKDDEDSEE